MVLMDLTLKIITAPYFITRYIVNKNGYFGKRRLKRELGQIPKQATPLRFILYDLDVTHFNRGFLSPER